MYPLTNELHIQISWIHDCLIHYTANLDISILYMHVNCSWLFVLYSCFSSGYTLAQHKIKQLYKQHQIIWHG